MTLIDKLKDAGVDVALSGNDLRVRIRGELTEDQREFLRQRKTEIRAELRSREELPDHIKERLRNVVEKLTADCLSWYRDDAEAIEQMGETDIEKAVIEFLGKREWYERGGKA